MSNDEKTGYYVLAVDENEIVYLADFIPSKIDDRYTYDTRIKEVYGSEAFIIWYAHSARRLIGMQR